MRISVTLLDSFRYWRTEEFYTEEAEEQSYLELCARIRGEPPPQSEDMLRSIAFHKICEDPDEYKEGALYRCDGWEFDGISTGQFLLELPRDRVTEVKIEQEIAAHTLVGKADYMDGVWAGDQKLTKKVTPDKYGDSIQWMAYLMLADLEAFRYHCAQPRMYKGVVHLKDYAMFPFYRSKNTDERVIRLVEEFGDFAKPILEQK